jgi:hypothetical protein
MREDRPPITGSLYPSLRTLIGVEAVSLFEKFLRDLPAIFRELYKYLFVEPDIHFRRIGLVAWVLQLRC